MRVALNHLIIAALAIMLTAALPAAAQQPAPQDNKQGQEQAKPEQKAEEKQEGQDETAPKPEKPYKAIPNPEAVVGLGWADWSLRGNDNKFRQYATPPRGVFLERLSLSPQLGRMFGSSLVLKGLGEDDYRLDGRFSAFYGGTKITGSLMRNRFFDPSPQVLDSSDRYIQEIFGKQMLSRGFSVAARYRMDEQNSFYEPPRLPLHQRTRLTDVTTEGKVGPGFLSLGITDWRFFDRTGALPDNKITRYMARYLWNATSRIDLETGFTHHDIEQVGLPTSRSESVTLTADALVGSASGIQIDARRSRINSPVTQKAYVRERRNLGGLFSHRWDKWFLNVGFRRRESERINATQTLVEVPKWSVFEGRLSGRLAPTTRLTLRGFMESLEDPPHFATQDPRSFYWDNRSGAQIRLETFADNSDGYIMGAWRRQDNDARKVTVQNKTFMAGGTWQPVPNVSTFVEYTFESWQGRDDNAGPLFLDMFMPSSSTTCLGGSWTIDKRTSLWMSLTHYNSASDNPLYVSDGNIRGDFFTLNLRHRFPTGFELGFLVAPWTYTDKVTGHMNYDSTVVMLTASGRY